MTLEPPGVSEVTGTFSGGVEAEYRGAGSAPPGLPRGPGPPHQGRGFPPGPGRHPAVHPVPSESGDGGREFLPDRVYRCDAPRGIEVGKYRTGELAGRGARPRSGGWFARWEPTSDGDWKIREAILSRPGEPMPEIEATCVDAKTELAAGAHFTLSVQGPPFGFFLADPHKDLEGAGRSGFRAEEIDRPGALLSSTYRVTEWLALGGLWILEPRRRTSYGNSLRANQWLKSGGNVLAVTLGYEGRNVSLDAGPALARSYWEWTDVTEVPGEGAHYSKVGAVVGARGLIPLRVDLHLEVRLHRLLVAKEDVPDTEPVLTGSRSGFYLGMGLASQPTAR